MARPSAFPDFATDATYAAGGNPWSGNANKVTPPGGVLGQGFTPQTYFPPEYLNYMLALNGQWARYLDAQVALAGGQIFGDGSDGDVTIDGSTIIPVTAYGWATLSSGIYTLTRDVFFNSFTIIGPLTGIKTNGYRIFCRGAFTVSGTVTIINVGASGTSGGAGGAGGSLRPGGGGGAATSTGTAIANSYGGSGGDNSAKVPAGGAAGAATAPSAQSGSPRAYSPAAFGHLIGGGAIVGIGGGGGGGGGSVSSTATGGGGGGVIGLAARTIVLSNASTFSTKGGDGQSAGGSNQTGGAGGGGGALLVVYGSITVTSGTLDAATCCPGGAGGAGTGTGATGSVGANGTVTLIQVGPDSTSSTGSSASPHEESGYFAVAPGTYSQAITYSSAFPAATGANAPQVSVSIVVTSGDPPTSWWISSPATGGCTINWSGDFTGEIRWRAR